MSGTELNCWIDRGIAFPIVVSGPSGVGKTTLVDGLLARDNRCVRSVSATTRPRRSDEEDGRSYFFVSKERFLQMQGFGELAESAIYRDHWYGTPKSFLGGKIAEGKCVVLNIEVQGGAQVRKHDPGAVLIFILPPSWEELRRRLTSRGTDTAEAIEARIRRGHEEVGFIGDYDYVVINDDLDTCVADMAAIVRAEHRRRERLGGRR